MTWTTKGEIFFARLDESGQLRNPQEIKTSGSNGMRTGLIVLATPDHQSTVVWKKDNRLGWQSYDAKGNAVGLPGLVPSEGNGVAGAVAQDGTVVLFR